MTYSTANRKRKCAIEEKLSTFFDKFYSTLSSAIGNHNFMTVLKSCLGTGESQAALSGGTK